MKVGIFTTFADLERSYSLVGVALEQAAMLAEHEVDYEFIVLENFHGEAPDWLNIRKELPTGKLDEDALNVELKNRTVEWLKTAVPEFDVIITHDMMFQTWFVTYNAAIREIIPENPGTTWVHWVHSAPSGRPSRLLGAKALRYEICPNSLYAYLNESDRLRYAESIGTKIDNVWTVYNPSDIATFLGADDLLTRAIKAWRLWDHDLMQVYPFSMPRAEAKGIEKVIGIFAGWKKEGYKVKLVFANCHCNQGAEQALVETFNGIAADYGLTEGEDLFWTSKIPDWEYSVPHTTIKKLFQLSNVFLFPTTSEACSRVLQEASLAGCLVLGNESFPPMNEFLDPTTPRHAFGSTRADVQHSPNLKSWCWEVAKATTPLLSHPMMRQKSYVMRQAARDTVWQRQFYPLLVRAEQLAGGRA
ncbi:MAG: glycosyltransferase family 4 protein [Gammaproteobacteria bacterium]|nr:glycosyltransferase family 4 protein [Gammaproteobacteria bacterium]